MGLLLCRGIVLGPIVGVYLRESFPCSSVWSSCCKRAGSGAAGRLVGAGGVLVLLD